MGTVCGYSSFPQLHIFLTTPPKWLVSKNEIPNALLIVDGTHSPYMLKRTFHKVVLATGLQVTGEHKVTAHTLRMAIQKRIPVTGLLHHSDQGVQYACTTYRKVLKQFNIGCSMNRIGNCWDNTPMESFFGTLKNELLYHEYFQTHQQAKQAIFGYIEVLYNRNKITFITGLLQSRKI